MEERIVITCCGEPMSYEWGGKKCKKCGAKIITMPAFSNDTDSTTTYGR